MIGQIRGRVFELRLLDHVLDLEEAAAETAVGRLGVEHAVGGDRLAFDHLGGDHRALRFVEDVASSASGRDLRRR